MAKKINNFDLKALIDSLPLGLERKILRILSYHTGRENAISRAALLAELARYGFDYTEAKDDRPVRLAINLLRKEKGIPICSAGGLNGGYWIAKDWDELEDYLNQEVRGRLSDLREQEQALMQTGRKMWGEYSPARQASLFGGG
jgi:hypothetical protein